MAEFKHKKLDVWQDARRLVKRIYLLSKTFPSDERFSLTDQIRRAAVSVPSNIAEGSGRGSTADFVHFLTIARGSLSEVDTQLTLAEDLEYITEQSTLHEEIETLAMRITSLMAHLRKASKPRTLQPSKHPTLQTSTHPTLQTSNPFK